MNNKEEYIIYIDASWKDKFGEKSFGSYVLYKNGKRIKKGTKKFNKRNYGSPEFNNFNYVAGYIVPEYFDESKEQVFIFKTDCDGLSGKINKLNNQIKKGSRFDFSNNANPFLPTLINTIKKYKNTMKIDWIPREENQEADLLAVTAFNDWLIKQHMQNAKEYMISDLKYTLMKWKNHFGKNYIEAREITNQFEDFINRIENE